MTKIQLQNDIAPSEELVNNERQFNIEMETGTGKTYVYLRSILKLNEQWDSQNLWLYAFLRL